MRGSRPDLVAMNKARANPAAPTRRAPFEYRIWIGMNARCHQERSKDFARYGARGITVCVRWRESFDAFLADVGERPSARHSIDRLDNGRGYEPGNCAWRLPTEQCRNRRSNRLITHEGATRTLAEWSELSGIGRVLIVHRIKAGWTVEDALTIRPSRSVNHRHAKRGGAHERAS